MNVPKCSKKTGSAISLKIGSANILSHIEGKQKKSINSFNKCKKRKLIKNEYYINTSRFNQRKSSL